MGTGGPALLIASAGDAPWVCRGLAVTMSAVEYSLSVACLLAIVCMVVIEMKPIASAGLHRALSIILLASLIGALCVAIHAARERHSKRPQPPTPAHYDLDTLDH